MCAAEAGTINDFEEEGYDYEEVITFVERQTANVFYNMVRGDVNS